MRYMKWVGLAATVLLFISCFLPWVFIPSLDFTVTGIKAGERFGSPGYFHFLFIIFFLLFTFIRRIWAKLWNLLFAALNLAWAIRNYFVITACPDDCPVKKAGIYLMVLASILMLVAALFPDIKLPEEKPPPELRS